MIDLEAFVLIGGSSSRFGSDKALIDFRGRSLLKRTVQTIRSGLTPGRITLVAANPDQFSMSLLLDEDVPFIFDLYAGRGSWGALHAALAYATKAWIFVVACDLPLITVELLHRLKGYISDDLDAIIPADADGRLQPLCALYRTATCRGVAEEMLSRNRLMPPLRSIAERVNARLVKFDEISDLAGAENIFLNANTVSDIELASKIAQNNGDSEKELPANSTDRRE